MDAGGHEHRVPRLPARDERRGRHGDPDGRHGLEDRPAAGGGGERSGPARHQEPGEHEVRRLEAEARDEKQVRRERAGDRPAGVPGVEPARGFLGAGAARIGEVQQQREGETQHERDRQHRREAEREAGELVGGEGDGQRAEGGEVGDRQETDRPLAGEHRETRAGEEEAHGPRRSEHPAAHARVDGGAEGDADEHRQQHQVEGVDRGADHQRVRPRPQHLDAEGGGSRGEGEGGAEGGGGPSRAGLGRRRDLPARGRLADLARPAPRDPSDEEARRRRRDERPTDAERRHQDEGRERDAEGAAQRVQEVQAAEARVDVRAGAGEELHRERHRRAQEDRRREEHERGEDRDAGRLGRAGEAGAGDERAVGPGERAQERQGEERGGADRQLDASVGPQRVHGRAARGERAARGRARP